MKITWTPGVPAVPGIYWFDIGLRFGWEKKKDRHPMVLQVGKGGSEPYMFGDFGSGPLSMYYSLKLCPEAAWADIEPPDEWKDWTCIKGQKNRAWIQTPEGHIGFGLLRSGWHHDVGGTFLWLDKPHTVSESGRWVRDTENYLYCLVRMPKI